MAAPYVMEENWEDGTKGTFDASTVDAGGALRFLNWRRLSAIPLAPMPWRGAWLPEIDLSLVDGDGTYFLENTDFDHSADATRFLKFQVFLTTDLVMAASDVFDIFHLRSASAAEVVVSIRNNAGAIEIGAGETAGTTRTRGLTLGVWHTVELDMDIDGAGDGSGTITLFLDGSQVGAEITGLTHATTTNARLGVQNIDAGTTTGRIYFDSFIYDDARIYPQVRHQNPRTITASEYFFLGPGYLKSAALKTTASDNVVKIFNDDAIGSAYTSGALDVFGEAAYIELDPDVNQSWADPGGRYFHKGCYVEISGTSPRVEVEYFENSPIAPGPGVGDGYLRTLARG